MIANFGKNFFKEVPDSIGGFLILQNQREVA